MFCASSSPTGTTSPRTPQPWHVPPLLWGPEEAGPPRRIEEETELPRQVFPSKSLGTRECQLAYDGREW